MPTRDLLRDRIADLRAQLDECEDTLDPVGDMSDTDLTAVTRQLDRVTAALDALTREVQALAQTTARIDERLTSTRQTAQEAHAASSSLALAVQVVQQRAEAAHAAADAAEVASRRHAERIRTLEDERIDRAAERRTYMALTGTSGAIGVVALGWSAWETIRLALAGG